MGPFAGIVGPIAGLIGSGCGMYVCDVVLKGMTPANLTKAGEAAFTLGGALIGCVVGSATGDYLENLVVETQKFANMVVNGGRQDHKHEH